MVLFWYEFNVRLFIKNINVILNVVFKIIVFFFCRVWFLIEYILSLVGVFFDIGFVWMSVIWIMWNGIGN